MSLTTSTEYLKLKKEYCELFGSYPFFNNEGEHTEEGMFAVAKKCVETQTPMSEEDFNCTYHPEDDDDEE
jgi:hypothetical protein